MNTFLSFFFRDLNSVLLFFLLNLVLADRLPA